jgi:hypothetical protein
MAAPSQNHGLRNLRAVLVLGKEGLANGAAPQFDANGTFYFEEGRVRIAISRFDRLDR